MLTIFIDGGIIKKYQVNMKTYFIYTIKKDIKLVIFKDII